MSDDEALTQFTPLSSATAIDTAKLASLYDYPGDLGRCWVRANMIASIDGAATVEGRSGGLAGAGDHTLFKVMRAAADVILVGAGTVRAENYSGAVLTVAARQKRQARGQSELSPIAVVTGSGALEPTSRLFTNSEVPPLIFTASASVAATRERLHGVAEVIEASASDPTVVDPTAVLAELATRGLYRVLCEGGPRLLGDVVAAGLLDELALTVAPTIVAGPAPRIVSGPTSTPTEMAAQHILTDGDGYLYTRYTRSG